MPHEYNLDHKTSQNQHFMTFNDRIELLQRKLGYNHHSFGKTLGLKSTSTIPSLQMDPDRKPQYDLLNRIASRFPDINMNWLLSGNGELFNRNTDDIPLIGDRIRKMMDFYDLNVGDILEKTGIHPAQLNMLLYKNQEPDEEQMHLLKKGFPDINEKWMYFNKGSMFRDFFYKNGESNNPDISGIPLFHSNVKPDSILPSAEAIGSLHIYGFEDCEMAYEVETSTMEPEIVPGDIILTKTIDIEEINYGERYFIVTSDMNYIKYVNHGSKPGLIILENPNGSTGDPFEISIDTITKLALIKGVVKQYL